MLCRRFSDFYDEIKAYYGMQQTSDIAVSTGWKSVDEFYRVSNVCRFDNASFGKGSIQFVTDSSLASIHANWVSLPMCGVSYVDRSWGAHNHHWRTQLGQVRVDRCTADQPDACARLELCALFHGEEGWLSMAFHVHNVAALRWPCTDCITGCCLHQQVLPAAAQPCIACCGIFHSSIDKAPLLPSQVTDHARQLLEKHLGVPFLTSGYAGATARMSMSQVRLQ